MKAAGDLVYVAPTELSLARGWPRTKPLSSAGTNAISAGAEVFRVAAMGHYNDAANGSPGQYQAPAWYLMCRGK